MLFAGSQVPKEPSPRSFILGAGGRGDSLFVKRHPGEPAEPAPDPLREQEGRRRAPEAAGEGQGNKGEGGLQRNRVSGRVAGTGFYKYVDAPCVVPLI